MCNLEHLYYVRVAKLEIKGVTFNIERGDGNPKYVFQIHDEVVGSRRRLIISRLLLLGYERGNIRGRYYLVSRNRCFFDDTHQVLRLLG